MPPRPAAPKLSSQIITNVDKQAVRDTNWPAEYSKKVDIRKVNMNVIETWIAGKLEQLGNDDDIVLSFIINLLKDKKNYNFPKIKEIQVSIRDFLGNDAPAFSKELWGLLLEAQEEENGVPPALVAAKKDELRKQKEQESKAREEEARRRETERERDREREEALARERSSRGGRFEGHYNDRNDRRGRRPMGRRRDESISSPSPPPNRRHGYQQLDSYVPRGDRDRHPRRQHDRRSRSPRREYHRSDRRADNWRPRSPPARRRRSTASPSSRSRSPEPSSRRRHSPARSPAPAATEEKTTDKKKEDATVVAEKVSPVRSPAPLSSEAVDKEETVEDRAREKEE